jgi:hypothetical protein
MTKNEAMQMAFETLWKSFNVEATRGDLLKAIKILESSLVQPEPKPFGYFCEWSNGTQHLYTDGIGSAIEDDWNQYPEVHENLPLYNAPPKKECVGLTEPEPFGIWHQGDTDEESDFFLYKDAGDVACETCVKLYTAPPKRDWQELTDKEIYKLRDVWIGRSAKEKEMLRDYYELNFKKMIKFIQIILKERNNG